MADINKLSGLKMLKSLTLHGNPIENRPGYRHHVITLLPQLLTLDFSGVTMADRATAHTWSTMIAPPRKLRKSKKKEDDD